MRLHRRHRQLHHRHRRHRQNNRRLLQLDRLQRGPHCKLKLRRLAQAQQNLEAVCAMEDARRTAESTV